jgi:exodeoxyribonuclease III
MKLISWNVNGIRSVMGKGFLDFIDTEKPDVLCLQEIKAHPDQVDTLLPEFDNHIWNPAEKKGYSGTAIFSKMKPLSVQFGKELLDDTEGRVIVAEFEKCIVINVYTPNSQRGLTRLKHRLAWDESFRRLLKKIDIKKPVIFCGDLNVAHTEIDIARPKDNVKNAGFTPEERASFTKTLELGFIDTFRHQHLEEKNHYTWWSYMHNARAKNIGWRIDYICASQHLLTRIGNASIYHHIFGSDHCPIGVTLKD